LKFTDYYGGVCVICGGNVDPDEGYLTDEEIQKTYFVRKQEMSYHKDGSLLNKNKDFKKPIYTNPLGEGIRCTPTDSIDSLQPLFFLDIRRLNIYHLQISQKKRKGLLFMFARMILSLMRIIIILLSLIFIIKLW